MKRNFTNISFLAIVLGGTAVFTIAYDFASETSLSEWGIISLFGMMLVAWLIIVGFKALIWKVVKIFRRKSEVSAE